MKAHDSDQRGRIDGLDDPPARNKPRHMLNKARVTRPVSACRFWRATQSIAVVKTETLSTYL
ncbi:hypothetical protein J2D73_05730 [Acetobacter sacchari]|uniref:Uncharacterized protein n=1 Tax=Acetobacter sacchari TaxID=2661687 RepID=A0ABS3LTQ6_9PROT|nr:hypothetical protein [Acetobacter sacchari]MBO1359295.1 hypothetical protein [Acetobacter sacchari]